MALTIRKAEPADASAVARLLVEDARRRQALDPLLWAVAGDAGERVSAGFGADAPFRQTWLVAEAGGGVVAVSHSMLLPVPPLYAGTWGEPGLLLEDCALADAAPPGTAEALLDAAEADLAAAGARLLLAASVPGGAWQAACERRGYEALTLYLSRDARGGARPGGVRPATADDVPGIVARSAENRVVLAELDPFWATHAEADARFAGWMRRSLTLADRDMLVAGPAGALDGYAIAQPASRLHVPAAHDVARIGFIDDYFHVDYADPAVLRDGGAGAARLLRAAEAALADRGFAAAFAVCPAAWASKVALLQAEGYETAMVWMIKRPS
jgi:hypothetical protein